MPVASKTSARLIGVGALLVFGAIIAFTFFNRKSQVPVPDPIAHVCQAPLPAAAPASSSGEIRIYQDVTESMRGFLMSGQEPPYHKFLDAVDMAAYGTGTTNISFWQFGTEIDKIPRADRHDQTKYINHHGYENNDYRVVIKDAPSSALTLIVTDLFQSDNDFPDVAANIRSRYFSTLSTSIEKAPADGKSITSAAKAPESASTPKVLNTQVEANSKIIPDATPADPFAFAVVGTKLMFNGPIYDLGHGHEKLPSYKGDRPIYVMAFGARSQVLPYVKAFQASLAKTGLTGPANVLLVSQDLVTCLPVIDVPPVLPDQVKAIAPDSAGGIAVENADLTQDLTPDHFPLMKQFLVDDQPATITLAVPVTPIDFLPAIKGESLAVETSSERWVDSSPSGFQSAPEATGALQVSQPSFQNPRKVGSPGVLTLVASLQTQKLIAGPVYRFPVRVELNRDQANSIDPQWVKEWSFTPPDRDGSKTQNLAPFIFTLRSQMMSREVPVILRAFFYVKKR